MSADAHFLDRLTLTRVDRDIFTGYCHAGRPAAASAAKWRHRPS